jgi:hypothetical protein
MAKPKARSRARSVTKPTPKKASARPVPKRKANARPAPKRKAPAVGPSPKASGDDRWWAVIEASRKGAEDADDQGDRLIELLQNLDVDEIVAFDRFLQERVRDAFAPTSGRSPTS